VGGKSVVRELKADTAIWGAAETHTGENVETTETHVLVFELKRSKGAKAGKGADPMKGDPAHFKAAETHAATVVEGENHGLLLEPKPPRGKPKM
jgi:hypothetical protein